MRSTKCSSKTNLLIFQPSYNQYGARIVEMNAPDKHTANMRRPAGPVLGPFEIPRDP